MTGPPVLQTGDIPSPAGSYAYGSVQSHRISSHTAGASRPPGALISSPAGPPVLHIGCVPAPAFALTPTRRRARLNTMPSLISTIYKKTFWNTYDHIGRLILLNLLWTAFFPLPTYLAYWLLPLSGQLRIGATLLVGVLTHSFATTGVFAATADIVDYRKFTLKQFFTSGLDLYFRSLALTILFLGVCYLNFTSITFYLALEGPAGILGFFLVGAQVWIVLFVLVMRIYLMPLLVKKRWGVFKTVKWSAILVVLKPGLGLIMMLQALAAAVIIGITIIGAIVILMSALSVFLNTTLREILKELEQSDEPRKKPTSWKDIFEEERARDEEPRTFKDLLHPWDN